MIAMSFANVGAEEAEMLLRACGREGYAVQSLKSLRGNIRAVIAVGRTCRVCGCSEMLACRDLGLMADETCSWVEKDLCSNPACLVAAVRGA